MDCSFGSSLANVVVVDDVDVDSFIAAMHGQAGMCVLRSTCSISLPHVVHVHMLVEVVDVGLGVVVLQGHC